MATDFYEYKVGQRGNHINPTPYTAKYATMSTNMNGQNATGHGTVYIYHSELRASGNGLLKLRNRLSEKVRGSARSSLALTLKDMGASASMIATRAAQVSAAYSALRRGNIPAAFKTLMLQPDSNSAASYSLRWTREKVRKNPSRAWLELNFGWVPLFQDIYDSTRAMAAEPPVERIKVFCFDRSEVVETSQEWREGSTTWGETTSMNSKVYLASGCDAYVVNPNLAFASSLGLTNPAHVLWDLVPFSFVVDWFLPVGKFLNTFDAFLGFEIRRGWTTVLVRGNGLYEAWGKNSYWWPNYNHFKSSTLVTVERSAAIPSVPNLLSLRPSFSIQGFLWKAATSVALVQTTLRS